MKKTLTLLALLMNVSLFAENGANQPPDQGFTQTLLMIAVALVFFYLILWRPEQKRRKAQDELRNTLKKGDRVTAMGIIGTVHQVQEQTVILKMIDGTKIEFLKAAISEVIPATENDEKKINKEGRDSKQVDISDVE